MNKVLLISEDTLKTYTLISENLDGKYILPAIQLAQDVDLTYLIGEKLVNKICQLITDNQLEGKYKTLLDEYITPYLCWQVMSTIQLGLNYKFSNSGLVGNDDERKSRLEYRQAQSLQEQYLRYADSYAHKMKKYICKTAFPEYECEDLQLCGIYLDSTNKSYIGK